MGVKRKQTPCKSISKTDSGSFSNVSKHTFRSVSARAQFESRYSSLPVVGERPVKVADLEVFEIGNFFNSCGWSKLLSLEGNIYPELVQAFYANFHIPADSEESYNPSEPRTASSQVRGVDIHITPASLAAVIGIPLREESIGFPIAGNFSDRKKDVTELLCGSNIQWGCALPANRLLMKFRIAHFILCFNLFPKAGHRDELLPNSLDVLFCMAKRVPLDVADIVWHSMASHNRSLPFGLIVSRLLAASGVHIDPTDAVAPTAILICRRTINFMQGKKCPPPSVPSLPSTSRTPATPSHPDASDPPSDVQSSHIENLLYSMQLESRSRFEEIRAHQESLRAHQESLRTDFLTHQENVRQSFLSLQSSINAIAASQRTLEDSHTRMEHDLHAYIYSDPPTDDANP